MIIDAQGLAVLDALFGPVASSGPTAMPFDILAEHELIAIPFYEQDNVEHYQALRLGPSAAIRRWSDSRWLNFPASPDVALSDAFVEIDSFIQYVVDGSGPAFFNFYTEIAIVVGAADALRRCYAKPPEALFAESCANTIGQGVMNLPRHADCPAVFALFGRQFGFPILL